MLNIFPYVRLLCVKVMSILLFQIHRNLQRIAGTVTVIEQHSKHSAGRS